MAEKIDYLFGFCPIELVATVDPLLKDVGTDAGNDKTFTRGINGLTNGTITHKITVGYIHTPGIKETAIALAQGVPQVKLYWESDGWTLESAVADMGLTLEGPPDS